MKVARRYARALLGAATGAADHKIGEIADQLNAFYQGVMASEVAEIVLFGRQTSRNDKVVVLEKLFKEKPLAPLTQQFLIMIASKGRLGDLGLILNALKDVRWEAEGGIRGTVVAAEPMSDADVLELSTSFTKKLGKKVSFQVGVDPALLAGVRVTVQGVTYDGTLQSQLGRLKERFMSGALGA